MRLLTFILILSLTLLPARAQESGEPRPLNVTPVAAPSPSLKYRLLPATTELVPGNAAALYYRTFSFLSEAHPAFKDALQGNPKKDDKGEEYSQTDRWLTMPLKDMPQKQVEDFVAIFNRYLQEMTLATHRQNCDWDVHGRTDGLLMLMPEVQSFRSLANIVALKARLQIAQGHYDQAIQTLQINFKLAEHLSRGPTVIHTLVGMAIARMSLVQIETMIQTNQGPNLYWALSTLPSPFADLKEAVEFEPNSVFRMIPSLLKMEDGPASAELMATLKEDKLNFRRNFLITKGFPEPVMIGGALPDAKARLQATGFKQEVLDKMPSQQIVIVDAMRRHRSAQAELSKWLHLPYAQAAPHAEKELKAYQESCAMLDLHLFDSVLEKLRYYDGFAKAWRAGAILDRQIAALRTIEAIRMQAAKDQGKLPRQLSDVKVVPVPIDPMMEIPFQYRLAGDTITLHAPAPLGGTEKHLTLTYVLKFEGK
ncbi:MAG TPA: hypothetical protein PLN21_19240 [Gemmatales bacterium]|nr:hypothetical protein [Gemmatales bacterium]